MPRPRPAPAPDDEVLAWLRQEHPPLSDLTAWARGVLVESEPDLAERVYHGWNGIGFRHPDAGYVCALFPREDGLRLWFEHGGVLDDPEGALVGEGKRGRSVPIIEPDANTAARIRDLLERAIAYRLAT